MANQTAKENSFAVLSEGVQYAVQDGTLLLAIPLDRSKGKPSSTGKMVLTGSTGGFMQVPGTDIRVNVMAGFRAAQ